MSILLAPYNDSMRLGMGFNSYTQTMCTDNAVKVTRQDTVRSDNPSQVVTYSSKVVENLSEVVGSMNISYSSSIRKGTVEVAGSSNSINEDKIKQSDLNAVVSVKVVNQTTIINEDCEFQPLAGVVPGSKDFDDAFGDCYISGFIEGGDFNGIISMRVMDRSKVQSVSKAIKKSLSAGSGKDFTLDMDTFTADTSHSDALNNTETTISVSWMGGGQIKDASTKWELSSVFAAAAAFPSQVAKCPQRTWAILTKYKANRSFQAKLSRVLFSPLEYDAVASYTQELFENFMEYKQLMKLVQDMMNSPSSYEIQKAKHNGITLEVRTLVAVRTAMRQEMNKIVAAVDVLSRDPNSLKRDANSQALPSDALVQAIIKEALGGESQPQSLVQQDSLATQSQIINIQPATPPASGTGAASEPDAAGSTTSSDGVIVDTPSSGHTEAEKTSPPPSAPIQKSQPREQIKFDYSKLMAPEIWSDLLPLPVKATPIDLVGATDMPGAISHNWAVAPDGDEAVKEMARRNEPTIPKLTILAAVCGVSEITDALQSLVTKDETLKLKGSDFLKLVADTAMVNKNNPLLPYSKQVGFVYQYADKPMRLVTVKNPETADADRDIIITIDSNNLVVTPSAWNADTWSITALTWGAKCFNDSQKVVNMVQEQIRSSYNGGKGQRVVWFDNDRVGDDPWPGYGKLGMIFYQVKEGGRMHVAVSVEELSPALMTDSLGARSLADHLEMIKLRQPPPPTAPPPPTYDTIQSGVLNSNRDAGIKIPSVNGFGMTTTKFNPPFKNTPTVLTGLRHFDIERNPVVLNTAFDADYASVDRTGFNAWARSHNGCFVYVTEASWLALPEKDYHMEAGVINTLNFNNAPAQKIESAVQFKKPFNGPPKVVCWISAIDLSKQASTYFGLDVKVNKVDANSCIISIETWDVLNFNNATVGWFAYEASEDGNRVQCFEIHAKTGSQPVKQAFNKAFTKTPAVFSAFKRFGINNTTNPRLRAYVRDMTPESLILDAGTFADTKLQDMVMTVIAIEP